MKISIFGDSIGKGVVYNEEKGKYVLCRQGFCDLLKSKEGLLLENFSHMGFSSIKGLKVLDKYLSGLSGSDYTILEYGGNDCDLEWNSISEMPFHPHHAAVSLEQFRSTMLNMVRKVREAGSTPVLMTLPPLVPERFFRWVSRDLDWESIYQFLECDLNNINSWQEEYSDTITRIAKDCDVPLIDVRQAFLADPDYANYYCIDGIHPNAKGHRLIASQLTAALMPEAE